MLRYIDVEISDAIAVVTLSNPPSNVLSYDLIDELRHIFSDLDANSDVARIVITGGAYAFSTGFIIADYAELLKRDVFFDLCSQMEEMATPIIAAIQGVALDAGMELALACDGIVAHPDATLGFPISKLDALPASGALQRLVRRIGVQETIDVFLAGQGISIDALAHTGIVDAIDPYPEQRARTIALVDLPSKELFVGMEDPRGFVSQIEAFRDVVSDADPQLYAEVARVLEGAQLLPFDQAMNVEVELAKMMVDAPSFIGKAYAARAEHFVSGRGGYPLKHISLIGPTPLREWMAAQSVAYGVDVFLAKLSGPIPEGTDLILIFAAFDHGDVIADTRRILLSQPDAAVVLVSASAEDDWDKLPEDLRSQVALIEFAMREDHGLRCALVCGLNKDVIAPVRALLGPLGIMTVWMTPEAVDVTGRVMAGFALSYETLLRRGVPLDDIDTSLMALGFTYPFGRVAQSLGPEGVAQLCARFGLGPVPFYGLLAAQEVSFDPEDAQDLAQLADEARHILTKSDRIARLALAGPLMVLLDLAQSGAIERLSDADVWLSEALGLEPAAGGILSLASQMGPVNFRADLADLETRYGGPWHVPAILGHVIVNGIPLQNAALRRGQLKLAQRDASDDDTQAQNAQE